MHFRFGSFPRHRSLSVSSLLVLLVSFRTASVSFQFMTFPSISMSALVQTVPGPSISARRSPYLLGTVPCPLGTLPVCSDQLHVRSVLNFSTRSASLSPRLFSLLCFSLSDQFPTNQRLSVSDQLSMIQLSSSPSLVISF